MKSEISVIIPALNEEKYIKHAFEGLRKQTFKKFETIVVDGGSSDNTRKIAEGSSKIVVEKRKGPAIARNAGARVAKGKILLFLDADTQPSKNLLKLYSREFQDKSLVAATGPILPLENANPIMSMGYEFVSFLFVRLSIMLGRPSIVGANFAVRKKEFDEEGGFNAKMLTYEDWDLSLRLKKYGKIKFFNEAIVYTSIRRIKEWGVFGFFRYYVGNIARYTILKKPKGDYLPVR